MDGKLVDFEQFKKKIEEKKKEEEQRLLDDEAEKDRIAENIPLEQIILISDILSIHDIYRDSLLYKTAFAELNKKPVAEVGDIVNNAKEEEVEMRPEYFRAALDIITGEDEIY